MQKQECPTTELSRSTLFINLLSLYSSIFPFILFLLVYLYFIHFLQLTLFFLLVYYFVCLIFLHHLCLFSFLSSFFFFNYFFVFCFWFRISLTPYIRTLHFIASSGARSFLCAILHPFSSRSFCLRHSSRPYVLLFAFVLVVLNCSSILPASLIVIVSFSCSFLLFLFSSSSF